MSNLAIQGIIRNKIKSFGNRVFRVEFLKKDGSLRKMTSRTGVSKGVKGTGKTMDIVKNPNMITVTDMAVAAKQGAEKAFRVISLDQIKYLACGADTFGSKDKGE